MPGVTEMRGVSYRVRFAADRHMPARTYGYADAELLLRPLPSAPPEVIVLRNMSTDGPGRFDWSGALYLWDDGTTVRPFYVAGWKDDEYMILHLVTALPGWELSPRIAVHVTATAVAR